MEEAVRFLVNYLPREASIKKPVLLHSIRVGNTLFEMWYNQDIIIGWYLHDLIEDSTVELWTIQWLFWKNVWDIVQANSKNKELSGSTALQDMIDRCNQKGKDALIVKAADVYDNYLFYKKIGDDSEIQRAVEQAKMIFSYLSDDDFNDAIFYVLKSKVLN